MNNGIDLVFFENFAKGSFVAAVNGIMLDFVANDLFNSLHRDRAAVGIIIDDDNIHAGVQDFNAGMRTDITGTACQKYTHRTPQNNHFFYHHTLFLV